MSHVEATSCKLPLLDGEDSTAPRLTTTEFEPENAERLQKFDEGDVGSFNDILCTAWGLLLRCYTGQDNVFFHFRQSNVDNVVSNLAVHGDYQSTFQMTFHEQESLSTCISRAKDGYTDDERGGTSLISTASDSRPFSSSHYQNTHVWVQNATRNDMQDVAVQKVL